MGQLIQRDYDRLKQVHQHLIKSLELGAKKCPIEFHVADKGGARTQTDQDNLYAQGRTKPGPIVTWTRTSHHIIQKDGYGHAVDIVAFVNGKPVWDEHYYSTIATYVLAAAKELGYKDIQWGITDSKGVHKDKGHYQKNGF